MSKPSSKIQFTLGCDPELFLTKKDGSPLSALGIVPGTKKEPSPVDCGAIQVDGMAAEFNTDPVSLDDFDAFNTNVVRVMKSLETKIKSVDPDARIKLVPTMDFGKEFLDAQPDEAKELGCDPDYSAYTMEENPRPDGERTFRTGAGHIHIGWGAGIPADNPEHMAICAGFVKMLDATVGLFMTYIDRDPRRRELYGKAGAFRPKSYGVEYRTPSNVWLRSVSYRRALHVLTRFAVRHMKSATSVSALTGGYTEKQVQDIINTGNFAAARQILNRYSEIDYDTDAYVRAALATKDKEDQVPVLAKKVA